MPDVQVLQAIDNGDSILKKQTAWKTALLALAVLVVKLFKTNTTPSRSFTLADMGAEADYGGYAEIAVASFAGPHVDGDGVAYMATPVCNFDCDGTNAGNTIYTAALCGTLAGGVAATATATQSGGAVNAITVTAGGGPYALPPKVTIGDATIGTGAKAHAVLTAGVVTSIVIDAPGSGYTGPTVTMQAPLGLIAGAKLNPPLPMILSTDGAPIVLQLSEPSPT